MGWFLRILFTAFTALGFGFSAFFAVHVWRGDPRGFAAGELGATVFFLLSLLFAMWLRQSWAGRTRIRITSSDVRISYTPRQWRFLSKLLVDRKVPTRQVECFKLKLVPIPVGKVGGVWGKRLHVVTHRDFFRVVTGDEIEGPVLEKLAARLNWALEAARKAGPYR